MLEKYKMKKKWEKNIWNQMSTVDSDMSFRPTIFVWHQAYTFTFHTLISLTIKWKKYIQPVAGRRWRQILLFYRHVRMKKQNIFKVQIQCILFWFGFVPFLPKSFWGSNEFIYVRVHYNYTVVSHYLRFHLL